MHEERRVEHGPLTTYQLVNVFGSLFLTVETILKAAEVQSCNPTRYIFLDCEL